MRPETFWAISNRNQLKNNAFLNNLRDKTPVNMNTTFARDQRLGTSQQTHKNSPKTLSLAQINLLK